MNACAWSFRHSCKKKVSVRYYIWFSQSIKNMILRRHLSWHAWYARIVFAPMCSSCSPRFLPYGFDQIILSLFSFFTAPSSPSGIKKWDGGTGIQHAAFMQKKMNKVSPQQQHTNICKVCKDSKRGVANIVIIDRYAHLVDFLEALHHILSTVARRTRWDTDIWRGVHPLTHACLLFVCFLCSLALSCVFFSQGKGGVIIGSECRGGDGPWPKRNWTVNKKKQICMVRRKMGMVHGPSP